MWRKGDIGLGVRVLGAPVPALLRLSSFSPCLSLSLSFYFLLSPFSSHPPFFLPLFLLLPRTSLLWSLESELRDALPLATHLSFFISRQSLPGGFEPVVLPQPPDCWAYRCVLLHQPNPFTRILEEAYFSEKPGNSRSKMEDSKDEDIKNSLENAFLYFWRYFVSLTFFILMLGLKPCFVRAEQVLYSWVTPSATLG